MENQIHQVMLETCLHLISFNALDSTYAYTRKFCSRNQLAIWEFNVNSIDQDAGYLDTGSHGAVRKLHGFYVDRWQ